MSRRCDYCGKGRLKGHRVSHAKNRTIRHFKPNLQWRKVTDESGQEVRRRLCASCLKKAKAMSSEQKKKGNEEGK